MGKRFKTLDNQYYVWAKQQHKIWRIQNDVDVIITDSPVLFSLIYGNTSKKFKEFVLEMFNSYNNINFMLQRIDEYTVSGCNETKDEEYTIGRKIENMLFNYSIPYKMILCNHKSVNDIVKIVLDEKHITHRFAIKELSNG